MVMPLLQAPSRGWEGMDVCLEGPPESVKMTLTPRHEPYPSGE
jgi:hypothetical protein